MDQPSGSRAVDRALKLMLALIDSRGQEPLSEIARALGLAPSTAHRMAASLEASGIVTRTGRGRYAGGLALARRIGAIDVADLLARAARPALRALADQTGRTAHLGVFEGDMVTYLVRESPQGQRLFTQESKQLEAYCSGIGKVLLSLLTPDERERYIQAGEFVPLTAKTITDRDVLRAILKEAARAGHACDDEEIEAGLYCIAVPLAERAGLPCCALSLAGGVPDAGLRAIILSELEECARTIDRALSCADFRVAADPKAGP